MLLALGTSPGVSYETRVFIYFEANFGLWIMRRMCGCGCCYGAMAHVFVAACSACADLGVICVDVIRLYAHNMHW